MRACNYQNAPINRPTDCSSTNKTQFPDLFIFQMFLLTVCSSWIMDHWFSTRLHCLTNPVPDPTIIAVAGAQVCPSWHASHQTTCRQPFLDFKFYVP